jgi:hypothetical protein
VLIAGPEVWICDTCTSLCEEIVVEHDGPLGITIPGFKIVPESEIDKALSTTPPEDIIATMTMNPVFIRRRFEVKNDMCFYLGPFKEPFNAIYKDHIVPELNRNGFHAQRADEIFSTGPIVDDIWEGINSAAFQRYV